MQLDVLFEDNHQLVLNKPSGLLTQPSGTEQESLESLAKNYIKTKYQKPGHVFLEAVHRIDKPVSGIVLFARTSKALSRLQAALREKKSEKIYLALVEGNVKQAEGTLEHYLVHDDFRATLSDARDAKAKWACLHYRVVRRDEGVTLLEIVLETGRYHQIRVQLAAIGHPIVGDGKYGSRIAFRPDAIALHHYRLKVPHPITGEMQLFEAPAPF